MALTRFDHVAALVKPASFGSSTVPGPMRAQHIVFVDDASKALLTLLDRIAPSDAPVQIRGETGTGKELVARYIHRNSGRTGPFLAVNCGAISEQLVESELFGHEAGSFTGASARREGWFEAANGGTLFLDEIGDLPLSQQGKLLRVLQEGEVTRVGARKAIPVDVRVVSATNVDLAAAVAAGRFRRDLFYRLNIVPVNLPALRERKDDIDALAEHFIGIYSKRLKRIPPHLGDDARDLLRSYSWPGNIRELENVIHYALLVASDQQILAKDLRIAPADEAPLQGAASRPTDLMGEALGELFRVPGRALLRDVERRLIEDAYRYCNQNQVRAAELLGISRNVVRTLLKRHGLLGSLTPAPRSPRQSSAPDAPGQV